MAIYKVIVKQVTAIESTYLHKNPSMMKIINLLKNDSLELCVPVAKWHIVMCRECTGTLGTGEVFLCSHHVYHTTQHSHLTFSKPLCRWYSTRNFHCLQIFLVLTLLNSSKTEFLIIGLKKQLSKTDSSSLNTTHSAWNLDFIFDKHLTFWDQISSLLEGAGVLPPQKHSCYSPWIQLHLSLI